MAQLQLLLFGTPRFARDMIEIPFRRRKALALIAFLAIEKRPQSRDKLCAMFWSDFDKDRARNNLRRELSLLNSILGHSILEADRSQIWLNHNNNLWLDVDGFQANIRAVDHRVHRLSSGQKITLEEAVDLYQDDFMAGFGLSDSPTFDEWQYFESENLRRGFADVLQTLIHEYIAQGNFIKAIVHCQRWLDIDSLHEPAQRQLMKLLAWSGQYSAALRQYKICVNLLKQELGVLPDEHTIALYNQIHRRQILLPDASNTT